MTQSITELVEQVVLCAGEKGVTSLEVNRECKRRNPSLRTTFQSSPVLFALTSQGRTARVGDTYFAEAPALAEMCRVFRGLGEALSAQGERLYYYGVLPRGERGV